MNGIKIDIKKGEYTALPIETIANGQNELLNVLRENGSKCEPTLGALLDGAWISQGGENTEKCFWWSASRNGDDSARAVDAGGGRSWTPRYFRTVTARPASLFSSIFNLLERSEGNEYQENDSLIEPHLQRGGKRKFLQLRTSLRENLDGLGKTILSSLRKQPLKNRENEDIVYHGMAAIGGISEELNTELETAFNYGHLRDGLISLDRTSVTDGQKNNKTDKPLAEKHSPHFSYNGKVYERKIANMSNGSYTYHGQTYTNGQVYWVERLPQPHYHDKETGIIMPVQAPIGGVKYSDNQLPEEFDFRSVNLYDYQNGLGYWKGIGYKDQIENNGVQFVSREIPEGLPEICANAFNGCVGMKNIVVSPSIKTIGDGAFACMGSGIQIKFNTGTKSPTLTESMFEHTDIKFIYLSKDGASVILSCYEDKELEKTAHKVDYSIEDANKFLQTNYRANFTTLKDWKEDKKIKFTPPEYTVELFPHADLENYFKNNNNQKWGQLVKKLGYDTLDDELAKRNSLATLMKLYYSVGGFSSHMGERDKAFDYLIENVLTSVDNGEKSKKLDHHGVHSKFAQLEISKLYNSDFAKFFMKYYKDNPDFMCFRLPDPDGDLQEPQDYLCAAHNSFNTLLKNNPNRIINTNTERDMLSPRFVAENCSFIEYEDIENGNEALALTVGRYGYTQEQFEEMQEVYNQGKSIKDKFAIFADKQKSNNCVKYRVLEKDDPLGFVLGNITNCCQMYGDAAQSCVDDGYKNPNSGFMIFEQSAKEGEPARILGQAWIWYDPKTKTVCLDNIEVPSRVLDDLRKGANELSVDKFVSAVGEAATGIITGMKSKGIQIDQVTTGKGYNDLAAQLQNKFKLDQNPKAKHRNYSGYSDAASAQFILATYDQATKGYSDRTRNAVASAEKDLADIERRLDNEQARI